MTILKDVFENNRSLVDTVVKRTKNSKSSINFLMFLFSINLFFETVNYFFLKLKYNIFFKTF